MKTQTKLKAIQKIAGIITIVMMVMTMIACPGAGQDGKHGIHGKNGADGADGADGKDGADGVNGKDAPILTTLWMYTKDNTPFPVLLEDQTGKLTMAQVDMFQDALYDFSKRTGNFPDQYKDAVTTGPNGNIKFIVEDVGNEVVYGTLYNSTTESFGAENRRTVHWRYGTFIRQTQAQLNTLMYSAMAAIYRLVQQ